MKLSPQKQKNKKSYPNIKDYKSKFMIAGFTIGMVLSPTILTSCNTKPTRSPGTMIPINKNNSKEKSVTLPNSKDESVTRPNKDKAVTRPNNDIDIKKTRVVLGAPRNINEDIENPPCDDKDSSKDESVTRLKSKDESVTRPNKDESVNHTKKNKNTKNNKNTPYKPNNIRGKIRISPKNK